MSRDGLTSTSVLLTLAAAAWLGIIIWVRSPSMMDSMPGSVAPTRATLFAGMWLVMMAAMMLPAVTPVVLLFRTVQRGWAARGSAPIPTSAFVIGYLAVWLAAGVGAFLAYAVIQAVAERIGANASWLPYAGGAIVVAGGIYQLTPLKNVCLKHCRSPIHFMLSGWGRGRLGAFRTGAGHGLFCLGCCWGIMAVLFVVGLMNLAWMAALSLVITIEKLAPRGLQIAWGVGGLFVVLGGLIALWPGIFSPAGLAMSSGMTMAHRPMTMSGMHGPGVMGAQVYRATAGPYRLTLSVGPAERMLTAAEAKRTHARSGEVMLGAMMTAARPMGGMSVGETQVQRHIEVHVTDRAMGMVVTNANVTMQLQRQAIAAQPIPLSRMYGVTEGIKDLHYGANVFLSKAAYTVRVRVDGYQGTFKIRIR